METPVHRFAVAVMIPEPIAGRIRSLQDKHDLPPWEPSIDPHITLVPPFTKHLTPDDLAAMLEPVAAGRVPFQLTLDGFGRFDNRNSVIFVRVLESPQLARLAADLRSALIDLLPPARHPFTPHATLAQEAPKEVIDEYFERLATVQLREQFTCDRFALLELDETARKWHSVREFILA